jgi:hypothetical protein
MTTTTTGLPAWDDMSDADKGAALLHVWKRDWEGASYAVANYPCRYLDHPALVALTPREASRHAAGVCGTYDGVWQRLGVEEFDRLYGLVLAEPDRRRVWATRRGPDSVHPVDSAEEARELLATWAENEARNAAADPPWWDPADQSQWAVLHRSGWGEQWHDLGGCDGCKDGPS